jgi:hypothetical protein
VYPSCVDGRNRGLIVATVKDREDAFIVILFDPQKGHILESFRDLTEPELRELLIENYGESGPEIEARIVSARSHPGI